MRKAEIHELKRILQTIYNGDGRVITDQNLRTEHAKGRNTRGLQGVDWEAWKGRFHLEHATMVGHSFGAATTIEVLRDRETFPNFSQGIALDMWSAVLRAQEDDPIRVPLLAINSEAFMYWSDNFSIAKSMAEAAASGDNLSWLLTIQGSIHISQTDIPVLYPRTCSALLKMTVAPKRAISLNVNCALEFLAIVLPRHVMGSALINRGQEEGLLHVPITKDMPEEHKPDNKWIGMRLKIPHEFASRVRNKTRRGKGSRFPQPAEEVWMHVAPTREQMKSRGIISHS